MADGEFQTPDEHANGGQDGGPGATPSDGANPQDAAKAGVEKLKVAGAAVQADAAQAGKDMIRASRRAINETSDLWRRSLGPIGGLQIEMNQWFDDLWRQMNWLGAMRPLQTAQPFAGRSLAPLLGVPAVDLKETGAEYQLRVEVPGLTPQDLDVRVDEDRLVISGQKAEEHHDGGVYQISERRFGRFERMIPLPRNVDRGAIDASLESGVLTIALPKTADAANQGSRIEVRG